MALTYLASSLLNIDKHEAGKCVGNGEISKKKKTAPTVFLTLNGKYLPNPSTTDRL